MFILPKSVQNIFKKLSIRLGTTLVKVFDEPEQKQKCLDSDHEVNIKHSQIHAKHKIVLSKSLTYPKTSNENHTNQSLLSVAIRRKRGMHQILLLPRDKENKFLRLL